MANIEKRSNGVWRARYYDDAGKQHARHFPRKLDAKAWIDTVTASVVRGDYTDPKTARTTVEQWCANVARGLGDAPCLDSATGAGAYCADQQGVWADAAR